MHGQQVQTNRFGELAQLVRASALHAEGHRFDSDILHKRKFRCYGVVMRCDLDLCDLHRSKAFEGMLSPLG